MSDVGDDDALKEQPDNLSALWDGPAFPCCAGISIALHQLGPGRELSLDGGESVT